MPKEALDAIYNETTVGFETKKSNVEILNQQLEKGIFTVEDLSTIAERAAQLADPLYSLVLSRENNTLFLERLYPVGIKAEPISLDDIPSTTTIELQRDISQSLPEDNAMVLEHEVNSDNPFKPSSAVSRAFEYVTTHTNVTTEEITKAAYANDLATGKTDLKRARQSTSTNIIPALLRSIYPTGTFTKERAGRGLIYRYVKAGEPDHPEEQVVNDTEIHKILLKSGEQGIFELLEGGSSENYQTRKSLAEKLGITIQYVSVLLSELKRKTPETISSINLGSRKKGYWIEKKTASTPRKFTPPFDTKPPSQEHEIKVNLEDVPRSDEDDISDIIRPLVRMSVDEPLEGTIGDPEIQRLVEIERAELEEVKINIKASTHTAIAPNGREFQLSFSDMKVFSSMERLTREHIAKKEFPHLPDAEAIREVDFSLSRIMAEIAFVGCAINVERTADGIRYKSFENARRKNIPEKVSEVAKKTVAERLNINAVITDDTDTKYKNVALTRNGGSTPSISITNDDTLLIQIYFDSTSAPTISHLKSLFQSSGGHDFEKTFNSLNSRMAKGWKMRLVIGSKYDKFPELIDIASYKQGDPLSIAPEVKMDQVKQSFPVHIAPEPRKINFSPTFSRDKIKERNEADPRRLEIDSRIAMRLVESLDPTMSGVLQRFAGTGRNNYIPAGQIERAKVTTLNDYINEEGLIICEITIDNDEGKTVLGYYLKKL